MDKEKQKEALLKRTKKKDRKAPFSDTKQQIKEIDDYFDVLDDDEHGPFKRIREIKRGYTKLGNYIQLLENSCSKKTSKLSKWAKGIKKKPGQQGKRVSPLFEKIYDDFWDAALTRWETQEITKRLKLCYDDYGVELMVLSIPDPEQLALKYNVTPDTIRKLLNKWSSDDDAPFIKLCMNKPKNEGGRYIYGIGYWLERGRIPFFTKDRYEKWLRGVMFR